MTVKARSEREKAEIAKWLARMSEREKTQLALSVLRLVESLAYPPERDVFVPEDVRVWVYGKAA